MFHSSAWDKSLVDDFADSFDVSENTYSTCVVEEATDISSCVIVSFSENFALSDALIMDAVREILLLVVSSDTTSDTTSWWVSEGLPGVIKNVFIL